MARACLSRRRSWAAKLEPDVHLPGHWSVLCGRQPLGHGLLDRASLTYKPGSAYLGQGFRIKRLFDDHVGTLRAIDPRTGKIVWDHKETFPFWAGTLSTAGGLLFTGTSDGYVKAFDAKTGKELWKFQTGSGIVSSPVTWEQDGEQYIGLASGYGGAVPLWGGDMAQLTNQVNQGGSFWVFKLPRCSANQQISHSHPCRLPLAFARADDIQGFLMMLTLPRLALALGLAVALAHADEPRPPAWRRKPWSTAAASRQKRNAQGPICAMPTSRRPIWTGANLTGADLRRADLRMANLTGAILDGADLSGARINRGYLAGASLKKPGWWAQIWSCRG